MSSVFRRIIGRSSTGGGSNATRRRNNKSKPLAPLRSIEKVEHSWSIVSSDLESIGIDFFQRIFLDNPDALDLFLSTLQMNKDEINELKHSQVKIIHFVKTNRLIKAHARLVIMEVGRCVAGLYDMTILVPRLRSLGRMHGAAGVLPEHYSIFFKHLMETVRDRCIQDNEDSWDTSVEEAWITVKDCMYKILSKPDVEVADGGLGNLNRWDIISGIASIYACIVTPLRVSKLIGLGLDDMDWKTSFHSGPTILLMNFLYHYGLALLDLVVVTIFITELLLGTLNQMVKVSDLRKARITKFLRADMMGKSIRTLRWLGLHEAVTYPRSSIIFLLSYLLQYQDVIWRIISFEWGIDNPSPIESKPLIVGVHWTWAFGILRLVTIFRAISTMRQLEMMYTVNHHADSATRLIMRIARLILSLTYTSHVAAGLYVLVARIGLGTEAYYDTEHPAEQLATAFFPDYTILVKENSLLTNYLRCVHYAFTNLSGIGNHESTPYSALECFFTLVVNAVGATLYAFTTGLLLSMIEPAAEKANQFGDSAAALQDYMIDIGMNADDRERIIQGYILREMQDQPNNADTGPFAAAPNQNTQAPAYPETLIQNLPRYLQDEMHTVALSDAMKRRERAFRRCSNEFLTAIASSMKQSTILLPGDYLIREGDHVPAQLMIVEEGMLEVVVGGICIKKFIRGDMVSFHWIGSSSKIKLSSRHPDGSNSFSPLLLSDSIALASVRAMNHCKVATGLSSKSERRDIKKRYSNDWRELEEVLDNAKDQRRKSIELVSNPAVFNPVQSEEKKDKDITSSKSLKKKSRNSITDKFRHRLSNNRGEPDNTGNTLIGGSI